MKKIIWLFSFGLLVGSGLFLSTCKKDDPDKPFLTSLTPSSGHEGDVIEIAGAFLGSTQQIKFGSVDGVVIDPKGGGVTTQVPAGLTLGKVDVTVLTQGGVSNALSFTVIPPTPQITSINPVEGSPGTIIAITGKFLSTAKEVAFGSTKVTTLESKAETSVTVKVPEGAAVGATDVKVTTDGGTSDAFSFTVLAKPTITSFTPLAGPVGSHVIITGTGLEETSKVFFGTVEGTLTPMSTTQIDAVVPASAVNGKIKVVTPGGEGESTDEFIVKGVPVVTSFLPASGIVGTEVTITGQNFQVTGGATVTFDDTNAVTVTVTSDTQIKAIVPTGATTGKITVTTIAGTATSATDFTLSTAPTITSFAPIGGPAGTVVTITGTNFTNASSVKFNATEAGTGNFTVNSATQITATVPAGATTGAITVTTPLGAGASSSSFMVVGAPTITSFNPASGIVGSNVTITGTNLTGATSVKFGAVEVGVANFTINSATQITAKVPASAANGVISVTTPGGTASSATSFTVVGGPTVTNFNPTTGIVGTVITITGTNFTNVSGVKFNTTDVTTGNFTFVSATQITAKVPANASNGPISVVTPAGTGISANSFIVIGAPTITSFTPPSGAVGINVVITGTNFTNASSVKFNATESGTGNFTVNSATQITAKVPVGATTGVLSVTTPAGTGSSSSSFTVVPPPTVTAFNPVSGAIGQSVVITGTSFIAVSAVKFNGVAAVSPVTNSATQITATIPAGATTGKISVETAAGTGASAANFTVAAAPTVTTFNPASGVTGNNITITGTNFVNVSSVKFNATEVGLANLTVNSATQITAKVPVGATTGKISVTTPSGTGSSAGNFTIIALPTITSIAPASGIVGTSVVITGTSFTSVTAVKFNNTTATFTINSATQITATAPGGVTTGSISVTNPAGTANSPSPFTVILAPLIGSISPITGTPGTTLTITGSNLANATSVKFGGTTVTTYISNTDSQIKVAVPALAPGAVNVSVITAGGTSNTKTFTVVAAPVITSLKPNVSYKGFPIMILGSNLAGTIAVNIGATAATIMTVYDGSVIATIPGSMSNGTYNVTVSNEGGPSNGVSLNIITAPAGVGSPPSGTFVSPPPANFVNAISNFWAGIGQLGTGFGDQCPITNPNYPEYDPTYVCGYYHFAKDGTGKVIANDVTLTIGTGPTDPNLETYYGQWSAIVPDPCIQRLFLISAKDGHILNATVNVGEYFYGTDECH